jgi:hypothetical protein
MNEIILENWMWPLHCPFCGARIPGHIHGEGTGCAHLLLIKDALSQEVIHLSDRLADAELDDFTNVVIFSIESGLSIGAEEIIFAPFDSEIGQPNDQPQPTSPWCG